METVVPVPPSDALCGEPVALSEMLTIPTRDPVVEGVKVKTMVQVAAGATFAPLLQVLAPETAKSEAPTPLIVALLENVSVVVPVLVTMMVPGALVVPTD